MLDSCHMHSQYCGKDGGDPSVGSIHTAPARRLKIISLAAASLFLCGANIRGTAQQDYPSYDGSSYQNPSSNDCSDPAFSTSPECSRQNAGQNPTQPGQNRPNQTDIFGQNTQNS